MTAPTTLPALPAVPAPPGPTGPAGASGGSPAFADALDDALTSGGAPGGRQQAGPVADETSGDDGSTDQDGAVAPTVVLPPGLWVLLPAASAPSQPAGTAPTAAADAITAPTGVPVALPTAAPSAVPATTDPVASAAAPAAPAPATTAVTDAVASEIPQLVVATPTGTAAPRQAAAVVPPGAPALDVPTGPAPAAADTAASAPATLPLLVPAGAPSGGSADTAADDRSRDSSGAAAPAQPTPDADPVAAFGTAALPAPPGAALDAAATPPPAAVDEPVAAQLGRQLAVLTESPDGTRTMTLVITPDDLGPVSIQATITDGTLDLTLHGAHEHGRHALTEALPDLRRELETAGLSLRRLEVGADSGGDAAGWQRAAQQQLSDPRGGSPGRPGQFPTDGRSRLRDDDQPGAGTPARTADLSTSRGVDVRV